MDTPRIPQSSALQTACRTIHEWQSGSDSRSLDAALSEILIASRESHNRDALLRNDILPALLPIFNISDVSKEDDRERVLTLMRCIGNLVADEDDNRTIVIKDKTCLDKLESSLSSPEGHNLSRVIQSATIAISVFYNLCNDYVPAQRAVWEQGFHRALLRYILIRPWEFADDQLIFSLELLAELTQHQKDKELDEDLDLKVIPHLIRLPLMEELDEEGFLLAATAITPYLAYSSFKSAVLEGNHLPRMFRLLEKTTLTTPQLADEDDIRAAKAFEGLLLHCMSDISASSNFSDCIDIDGDFTRALCDRCILTENDADSASTAQCACILLANLATNDVSAKELAFKIKLPSLLDYICLKAYGRSRASNAGLPIQVHTEYLHSAGGMLRHLAIPSSNRANYFNIPQSTQAAIALAHYQNVEVQIQGLRLYRQILTDNTDLLEKSIASLHLNTIIRTFTGGTDDRVKLEVASTEVALVRGISKLVDQSRATGDVENLLSTVMATENLLAPLAYATKQTSDANVQAQAWLALDIILRLSSTAARLVLALFESDDVLDALAEQVVRTAAQGSTRPRKARLQEVLDDDEAEAENPIQNQTREQPQQQTEMHDDMASGRTMEALRIPNSKTAQPQLGDQHTNRANDLSNSQMSDMPGRADTRPQQSQGLAEGTNDMIGSKSKEETNSTLDTEPAEEADAMPATRPFSVSRTEGTDPITNQSTADVQHHDNGEASTQTKTGAGELVHIGGDEEKPDEVQDKLSQERDADLRSKARDNALVLLHDLLKLQEMPVHIRDKLENIAREAGIKFD